MFRKLVAASLVIVILALPAYAAVIAQFFDYGPSTGNPATQAAAVTPSDTVDLPFYCSALWVGGAGNIAVVMASAHIPGMGATAANAAAVVFNSVPAGAWMPLRVGRVQATSTTATNIDCVLK